MDAKAFNDELSKRLGRDPHDISLLCGELANVLAEAVTEGDSVVIPAFGMFEPKKRNERVAQHPSTGKKILLPPKLTIGFKPSATLRQKMK